MLKKGITLNCDISLYDIDLYRLTGLSVKHIVWEYEIDIMLRKGW